MEDSHCLFWTTLTIKNMHGACIGKYLNVPAMTCEECA